jgi:hypothetical protein
MEIGQKVVFVRDISGAGVGNHGTVILVADDAVIVGCKLHGHLAPVIAQMWDLLPERLWNRISKPSSSKENGGRPKPSSDCTVDRFNLS